jgi:hypothetical protein
VNGIAFADYVPFLPDVAGEIGVSGSASRLVFEDA